MAVESIVVEVGQETLEHGRVRAELQAGGSLRVAKVEADKLSEFEADISDAADELLQRADDVARAAPAEDRRYEPVPDEALYQITISFTDEEPVVIEVWQNELDDMEAARVLLRRLGAYVAEASRQQAVL